MGWMFFSIDTAPHYLIPIRHLPIFGDKCDWFVKPLFSNRVLNNCFPETFKKFPFPLKLFIGGI